jgi:uncharacterized protein YecE (DUF72 family)
MNCEVPMAPTGDPGSASPLRGTRRVIRVGTAGWANPSDQQENRQPGCTHLQHYAQHFNCVEINSSFDSLHRRSTYERWADSTAVDFRFSVKIPRTLSHDTALRCSSAELDEFVDGVLGLGAKLAVLLLQLPPQAHFQPRVARQFLSRLTGRIEVPIVCEPRHPSWAEEGAERLLRDLKISRADADPERVAHVWTDTEPVHYYRLHGSPRLYWSSYTDAYLRALTVQMTSERTGSSQLWCIFDNTAAGAAWLNARAINKRLAARAGASRTGAMGRSGAR